MMIPSIRPLLTIALALALQEGATGTSDKNGTGPCPSQSSIPVGFVQTYSAYSCRGELQTFANVTSGVCMDAKNFTTARGYRKGAAPEGVDCTFNFYASTGCKGAFVSAGAATDGSNNWIECVRNFLGASGDTAASGSSFMYACYGRK